MHRGIAERHLHSQVSQIVNETIADLPRWENLIQMVALLRSQTLSRAHVC